ARLEWLSALWCLSHQATGSDCSATGRDVRLAADLSRPARPAPAPFCRACYPAHHQLLSHSRPRGPRFIHPGHLTRRLLLDDRRARPGARSDRPCLLASGDRHESGVCGGLASAGLPLLPICAGMLHTRGSLLGTSEGRIYGAADAVRLCLRGRRCQWTILYPLFPPTPACPCPVKRSSPDGNMDAHAHVSLLPAATSDAESFTCEHCGGVSDREHGLFMAATT